MTVGFGAPEWLLLLPVLLFAAWYWRRPALSRPLRFACLSVLALALADPLLPRGGRGEDLWVLFDRSASARDLLEPRIEEIGALLERTRSERDRLFLVDYSDAARLRSETEGEVFAGSSRATATASAVQFALSRMAGGRPARILVVTDGYSTEPLSGLAERLVLQAVPLDYRLLTRTIDRDVRAESLTMPARVQAGEPFLVETRLAGSPDGPVRVTIARDGRPVGEGAAKLVDGSALVRFRDRLTRGGAYEYTVRVKADRDALPGNDEASGWIEVVGGPRIVLATAYAEDPVARVLSAQGFEVDVVTDLARLGPGSLAGARGVILNNVPAHRLPPLFLGALDLYVREQGGGLAMAGGRDSFGSGGYFGSAIDPLLPVSMELREEHRKLAVAMVLVLDRSGSMAAPVGTGPTTKMDLANEGAARSIQLLGANDAVAVLAVDSEAHHVVPLTSAGGDRAGIVDVVRRIQSGGGGIYVYSGLRAGWDELQKASQGQRHLLLFADAADAEEPGAYEDLLASMVKDGASVSVIGLGSETDVDAAFLVDVAKRGNGRIFFNADPASLPALFAQETVAVARSAFLEDPVPVKATGGWLEIAGTPVQGLDAVGGYNLSYLRPDATAAAFSGDAYAAPLIAFWHRGAGRVAAVSFPLGGEHSAEVRAWPRYGDFLQTLARWLIGSEAPPGIGLRARLRGSRLVLDLMADGSVQERLASQPPEALLAEGITGRPEPLVWERIEPGRFQTSIALEPDHWYRGAVRAGDAVIPFGPVEAPSSGEWRQDPRAVKELREVSALSGGSERTELPAIWKEAPRSSPRSLRPWLLALFVPLFLMTAAESRFGWELSLFRGLAAARERVRPYASVVLRAGQRFAARRRSRTQRDPGDGTTIAGVAASGKTITQRAASDRLAPDHLAGRGSRSSTGSSASPFSEPPAPAAAGDPDLASRTSFTGQVRHRSQESPRRSGDEGPDRPKSPAAEPSFREGNARSPADREAADTATEEGRSGAPSGSIGPDPDQDAREEARRSRFRRAKRERRS